MEPAPPPFPEVRRAPTAEPARQSALAPIAGALRDIFDAIDVRTVERPALRRFAGVVRRGLRRAAPHAARLAEPTELREARKLGPAASEAADPAPHVLVLTFRAWTTHVAYELLLGRALRRRGAKVTYALCGGGIPICELGAARREFPAPCAQCRRYVAEMLAAGGFTGTPLEDLVDEPTRTELSRAVRESADVEAFELHGIRLAPLVLRSLMWVTRDGLAARAEHRPPEFREFVESAAIVTEAFHRLLMRERPEAVVMVSGLFFAEAVLSELARARDIRVVTYDFPGRPGTVFASSREPASFYEIDEAWGRRERRAPSDEERRTVLDALFGRRGDDALWQSFSFRTTDAPKIPQHGARRVALFTNVAWDTAVTLRDVGFSDIYEWVDSCIAWALEHDDVHLDVRIHPGEVRVRGFESHASLADHIRERFPALPARIVVYGPDSSQDSYALLEAADAVLVYTSTMGLEAAVLGKPVLVSANVHYRGKGFTVDITGPEHLHAVLDDPKALTPSVEQRDAAIAYAYAFFFESMPELRSLGERWRGKPVFRLESDAELDDDPGIAVVRDLTLGVGLPA